MPQRRETISGSWHVAATPRRLEGEEEPCRCAGTWLGLGLRVRVGVRVTVRVRDRDRDRVRARVGAAAPVGNAAARPLI